MVLVFQCTFAFQEYNNIIIISDEGNNTHKCCVEGKCPCSSLEIALQNVNNNTLINITSAKETLPVQINITSISVIGIGGNNDTVIDCNNTGGVLYLNCKEIDIFGITWYQCGNNELHGAISLDHSHDISIRNCTFQSSNIHGIAVESLPGRIIIKDTEFLCNNKSSSSGGIGLFIQQTQETNPPMHLELVITSSMFKYNGVQSSSNAGGIYISITDSSSLVNVYIEDSAFVHNTGSGGMYVSANVGNDHLNTVINLNNVTFINNSAGPQIGDYNGDAIYCYTRGNSINFTVTDSFVYNGMVIFSNTLHTSVFMDKSLLENSKENIKLTIESYSNLIASFSEMNLIGTQISIIVKINSQHCVLNFVRSNISNNSSLKIDGEETNGCRCTITNCQFSNNNIETAIIDIKNIRKYYPNSQPFINISNTNISDNSNGDSIVRLSYRIINQSTPVGNVQLSSIAFTNNSAGENTLFVYNCQVTINNKMSFSKNTGKCGAGMYFADYSYAVLSHNADVVFMNNFAKLGGGAIYAEHPDTFEPWYLFSQTSSKSVTFINNVAGDAGNSIYFYIPTDVEINTDPNSTNSIVHIPSQFNYSGKDYRDEVSTSPYNLLLSPPAICVSKQCKKGGIYYVENIMLGEELLFMTELVDYFNTSAGSALFFIECLSNCNQHYITGFTKYRTLLIKRNVLRDVTIVGKEVKDLSTIIELRISWAFGVTESNIRNIALYLNISLCPCRNGFKYDSIEQKCICNSITDLVQCTSNDVKIKRGYWYGYVDGNMAVGICPNNYCIYPSCDINEKLCTLPSVQDHQCHSHRTGTACGNCENNCTLAFDLDDCIPTSDCHIWLTIVIIISVMIYWVLSLLAILCITGFANVPVITGYAYGIIYFYSILYLFVGNNLVSNTMTTFVTILSGFANLTPRFLGMLCFVKGLRGIDQQFIHYVHPLAVSLLLFLISRVAKHSATVTNLLGRAGIIRATCLFILLSYTSIASTSLQLLRPLIFTKSHGDHSSLHTYFSPDIQYFTGHHIVYVVFAVLCAIAGA